MNVTHLSSPTTKNTILVVDDNPVNLRVLCELLNDAGYHAHPAINGDVALSESVRINPDLILLDIRMPDMDGYEVCRRLKASSITTNIPVIFISAANEIEDVVKGFEVGGVDYVSKPFEASIVLVRIKNHLSLYHSQRALAEANAALSDIRLELERKVKRRTQEIQRAHLELERSYRDKDRLYNALKQVIEGVVGCTGDAFFNALTRMLSQSLSVDYVVLSTMDTKVPEAVRRLSAYNRKERSAYWKPESNELTKTICDTGKTHFYSGNLQTASDIELGSGWVGIISYAGAPVLGVNGQVEGVLEMYSSSHLEPIEEYRSILELFALRAGTELQRIDAEQKLIRSKSELELLVEERTSEIRAVNTELESFSYSVSHDLRAPLRTIEGFSQALLEDYEDKLDEQGKTFLNYLVEGTREMSDLIDGLLALSRSSQGELNIGKVNLSDIAKGVAADLKQRDPDSKAEIVIANDMEVSGDQGLLTNVMTNLMGNAWKYSAKEEAPIIHVGAETSADNTIVYYVKDNGAGFDMTHTDKLFMPFQRLHRASDYSGTGIGLATVKRIVNRHNGEIWATSKVNEGANFYFTLPDGGESAK